MPLIDVSFPLLTGACVIAYLLGSIPSGIVLARVMGLGDLRQIGSGNIGATNVLRTGSKKAAALTLLFDALKGIVAVFIGWRMHGADTAQAAALFAMIGHCYPVWLRFRGGKGVATYFGVLFCLSFVGGLIAAVLWLGTAAVSRYSSLAALVASGVLPFALLMVGSSGVFVITLVLAALIFWRHRGNMARLKDRTESRIGQKST